MPRKTVSIDWLKDKANQFLVNSDEDLTHERQGLFALLEAALHETGQYHGFRYLSTEWDEEAGTLKEDYEDTRREYY